MGKLYSWDIVGDCACFFRERNHLILWNIKKFSFFIDEPGDQPRTCDAINLWAFTCYPFHRLVSLLCIEGRSNSLRQPLSWAYPPEMQKDDPRIFHGHVIVNCDNIDVRFLQCLQNPLQFTL